jgi:hypothetical protein
MYLRMYYVCNGYQREEALRDYRFPWMNRKKDEESGASNVSEEEGFLSESRK